MKNLASITAKYLDRPFSEFGCIEFVCKFMEEIGTPLPDQVDGWNVENYKDLIKKDIHLAQDTMMDAFQKIGSPGNVRFPSFGDLLVIEQENGNIRFPAVYVGRKQAITSFIRTGVTVFKMDELNKAILCRRVK